MLRYEDLPAYRETETYKARERFKYLKRNAVQLFFRDLAQRTEADWLRIANDAKPTATGKSDNLPT